MKRKIDWNSDGHFENPTMSSRGGFELLDKKIEKGVLGINVTTYRLALNHHHPLIWVMNDGTQVMCADNVRTDFASVKPMVAQLWIPKDRFVMPFLHDAGYATGGYWVKFPGSRMWEWVEISWMDCNALLRAGCRNDPLPCGKAKPWVVWTGVTIGGWIPWLLQKRKGWKPHDVDPNLWHVAVPVPTHA